jgi:N2-acetyl-L-2,4-diaminobutanoate deacetylase
MTGAVTRVSCDVDLDASGKQRGSVIVESTFGNNTSVVRVPIVVVARGHAPTLLLTGGIHGDEFEGPAALRELCDSLDPASVQGRVIIMPLLNPIALAAGTRTSPLDSQDMNRSFPGSDNGSVTDAIANWVTQQAIARADAVFDLHAGGRETVIIPSVMTHLLADPVQFRRALDAVAAFGAPAAIAIEELETRGMIDREVERQGKLFGCAELGGAAMLSPESLAIARHGVLNIMAHLGIINSSRAAATPGQRLLRAIEAARHVQAPLDGFFVPRAELGDPLAAGALVAELYDPSLDSTASALPIVTPHSGILYLRATGGPVRRGDVVAIIAEECRTRADWYGTESIAGRKGKS